MLMIITEKDLKKLILYQMMEDLHILFPSLLENELEKMIQTRIFCQLELDQLKEQENWTIRILKKLLLN